MVRNPWPCPLPCSHSHTRTHLLHSISCLWLRLHALPQTPTLLHCITECIIAPFFVRLWHGAVTLQMPPSQAVHDVAGHNVAGNSGSHPSNDGQLSGTLKPNAMSGCSVDDITMACRRVRRIDPLTTRLDVVAPWNGFQEADERSFHVARCHH